MTYPEDEMLMLSGIQHYAFCPRQWALIHIDQQWQENILTVEGSIMHQHVDDPFYRQKMGDVICMRSVNIASKELGLYGVSDIIELHPSDTKENAIQHPKYPGWWLPYPIEYKHGSPKQDNIDVVQLCAQAICIEEIYGISISEGAIYYGQTHRRKIVKLDEVIRSEVRLYAMGMHTIFKTGKIPLPSEKSHCRSCSLKDLCMPKIAVPQSASKYIKNNLYEETT